MRVMGSQVRVGVSGEARGGSLRGLRVTGSQRGEGGSQEWKVRGSQRVVVSGVRVGGGLRGEGCDGVSRGGGL